MTEIISVFSNILEKRVRRSLVSNVSDKRIYQTVPQHSAAHVSLSSYSVVKERTACAFLEPVFGQAKPTAYQFMVGFR